MTPTDGPTEPLELARGARKDALAAKWIAIAFAVYLAVATSVALYLIWDQGRTIADCTTKGGACFEDTRRSSLEFRRALQHDLAELQANLGKATDCLVLQLAEHRDSNELAHALNAREHGYPYMAPAGEVPPPIPAELAHACDDFLPRGER